MIATSLPMLAALDLAEDGPDVFVGRHQAIPSGRAYGGELVAQAQVAMARTVDADRRVHSLHGYFLRAADVRLPTRWEVERTRDGRGFSARMVRGRQEGKVVFQAMASFHLPTRGVEHAEHAAAPPPGLPTPEELPSTAECLAGAEVRDGAYWSSGRSFDIRHVPGPVYLTPAPVREPRQLVWVRAFDVLPDDPALHRAALAYLCDYTLLETVLRRHGAAWAEEGVVTASLDHAMWWHRDGRADQWLLLAQESPSAGDGLGLTAARIFSRDGRLLASVGQEGLVRLPAARPAG